MILLSSIYASEMLRQFEHASCALVSLDLGKTQTQVSLREGVVCMPGDANSPGEQRVSLDALRAVAACEDAVFTVADGAVRKVILFSEATGRTYKLRPTEDWPALEISGILMHRIKGTTPQKDAQAKLRLLGMRVAAVPAASGCGVGVPPMPDQAGYANALGNGKDAGETPARHEAGTASPHAGGTPASHAGKMPATRRTVLDTCMGLGYTAILAAETADAVTAIEKDENVFDMARLNPYSQGLFTDPKIKLIHGDATEVVPTFGAAAFDIVNHDPPTLSVAGELYSDAFYRELLRILKPGGKLLHYTGAPGSRARRVDLPASVARRLAGVGFANVRNDPQTGCILATRPRKRA